MILSSMNCLLQLFDKVVDMPYINNDFKFFLSQVKKYGNRGDLFVEIFCGFFALELLFLVEISFSFLLFPII